MGSLPVRNLGGDRSVVVGGNIKCPGRKGGGSDCVHCGQSADLWCVLLGGRDEGRRDKGLALQGPPRSRPPATATVLGRRGHRRWGWARYPRTAGERPCPRCVQGVTASNVLARSKDCPCAQPRQQGAPARRLAGSGLTGSWEEWKSSGPERTLSAGLPDRSWL